MNKTKPSFAKAIAYFVLFIICIPIVANGKMWYYGMATLSKSGRIGMAFFSVILLALGAIELFKLYRTRHG